MKNVILIIGGGIAGLTTALALQKRNIDFIVFEAVPEIKTVGAGITLAGNAMRVLKKLGVEAEVKKRGHLIFSMIIEDDKGKSISVMDAEKLSREHGLDNVAIHRAELHQALLKNIPAGKIITNKKAIGYEEKSDQVVIHFEDGSFAEGKAAIVADGINSNIRKKLLPHTTPRYSGYTCWRGVVENTWNLLHHAVETWGSNGRFGYVPIGDNKVYWFACKNAPQQDEAMRQYTLADLVLNFKNYVHPIPSILENTPESELIWSDIIDLKPISRFAFGRVLLLGDAAHATTPNLGQGACMAMEDAMYVAEKLDQHREDVAKAFTSFESKRIARTHYIVNTSYRLGKLAQAENTLGIKLRNAIFRNTPVWVNERQMAKVLDI
jgi:2-polyprenyl-6-methoxyphenol hydroxylase-like FAD-dependent oxidoreductase